MNKTIVGNNIIVQGLTCFQLGQTLECGQCFHYDKIEENEYVVVAFQQLLHLRQEEDRLIFYNTNQKEFDQKWRCFFDLDRDYEFIQKTLIDTENKIYGRNTALKTAIEEMNGIRILNQDFFEMLISFIISQNKNITHIRQIIETLSLKYGEQIGTINGKSYYSFPSLEVLSQVTEHEFRLCKTGFRAPYLVDACKQLKEEKVVEKRLREAADEALIKELMRIKGVGSKVANCIALFGLGKRAAFPIDVWVKRMMEEVYFEKETSHETIKKFAKQVFGEYGGYAQQYLFHYGRSKQGH